MDKYLSNRKTKFQTQTTNEEIGITCKIFNLMCSILLLCSLVGWFTCDNFCHTQYEACLNPELSMRPRSAPRKGTNSYFILLISSNTGFEQSNIQLIQ